MMPAPKKQRAACEIEIARLAAELLAYGGRRVRQLMLLQYALETAASILEGQVYRTRQRLIGSLLRSANPRRPSRTIRRILGTWLSGEPPREAVSRTEPPKASVPRRARPSVRNIYTASKTPHRKVARLASAKPTTRKRGGQ
jgi:hypothetical protein